MSRELYMTILLLQYSISSVWLSPINVQLKDHEDFVISADATLSDDNDEEMVNVDDKDSLYLHPDTGKSELEHRQLQQSESLASSEGKINSPVPTGSQDMEDISLNTWKRAVQPITTEEGSILSHNTVDHVNKQSTNKSNQDKNEQYNERRLEIILQSSTLQAPTQYDYDSLRDEYYNDLQKELHSNVSFNYTQHDRFEETNEDAINEIFDFETTKNCSKEEYSNFGIKSTICSWDGLKKSRTKQDKMHFFKRLMKNVAIWLLICTAIGTICVCEFGQYCCCCCCCCCSFCQPTKRVKRAKIYTALNPPGVLAEEGTQEHHEPTAEEIQAYRKLLSQIQRL